MIPSKKTPTKSIARTPLYWIIALVFIGVIVGFATGQATGPPYPSVGHDLETDIWCTDPVGCIITAWIKDLAVTNAKLADNSVTTGKIGTSEVTTTDIANAAVSGIKLQNDSVDGSKIMDGAIKRADVDGTQICTDTSGLPSAACPSVPIVGCSLIYSGSGNGTVAIDFPFKCGNEGDISNPPQAGDCKIILVAQDINPNNPSMYATFNYSQIPKSTTYQLAAPMTWMGTQIQLGPTTTAISGVNGDTTSTTILQAWNSTIRIADDLSGTETNNSQWTVIDTAGQYTPTVWVCS